MLTQCFPCLRTMLAKSSELPPRESNLNKLQQPSHGLDVIAIFLQTVLITLL